jgi:hypothetical protein
MSFNHIMLDLETLDSSSTAVILSIGAVRFDLNSFELGKEFYCVVNPDDCQKYGLTISEDTVRFWLRQSVESQRIFFEESLPLARALQMFSEYFVEGYQPEENFIWGNGATFDNMVIRNAYRAVGHSLPWTHRDDLCYRTMRQMFSKRLCVEKQTVGVEHNALDDAKSQALTLIEIMKKLRHL